MICLAIDKCEKISNLHIRLPQVQTMGEVYPVVYGLTLTIFGLLDRHPCKPLQDSNLPLPEKKKAHPMDINTEIFYTCLV